VHGLITGITDMLVEMGSIMPPEADEFIDNYKLNE